MNYLLHTQALIIAGIIGIPLLLGLGLKEPLYIGFLVVGMYVILSMYLEKIESRLRVNLLVNKQPNNNNIFVEETNENVVNEEDIIMDELDNTQHHNNLNNNHNNNQNNSDENNNIKELKHRLKGDELRRVGNSDLHMPVSGPLDHLSPDELVNRLNYIHYATSHPYQPMKYQQFKTHNDYQLDEDVNTTGSMKATKSVKNLERANIHYPQLTENQVNYSDCTNHGYGPLSCNQAPDRANLFPPHQSTEKSLLVAGLNNLHDIKRTVTEDFSVPAPILDNTEKLSVLFKNAPGNPDAMEPIVDNLCRNCKVGYCQNDICMGPNTH